MQCSGQPGAVYCSALYHVMYQLTMMFIYSSVITLAKIYLLL